MHEELSEKKRFEYGRFGKRKSQTTNIPITHEKIINKKINI